MIFKFPPLSFPVAKVDNHSERAVRNAGIPPALTPFPERACATPTAGATTSNYAASQYKNPAVQGGEQIE